MAVLAIAAVGSAIGGAIGGTFLGVAAASWGWTIGAVVGQMLFPGGEDQHSEGPRFGDLKVTTSAYGQMIPIVYGTKRITGNIIWAPPVREVSTTTSQGGGKGGGPDVTQTTYSYFADFAVLLCEGEIAGVRKIWRNGELVYNVAADATSETVLASSLNASYIRVYSGSETQTADALIEADTGTETPGYRGVAYLVIEGMDVTPFGGRIPQLEFEVLMEGSVADLDVPTVSTLTASDGSTFVVLGRGGDVYAGAVTSNSSARRWNFYTGAKVGEFIPPTYSYKPCGLTIDGECIATGSSSGVLAVLHEDGTTTRYTGAFADQGNGLLSTFYAPGIVAESDTVWWSRGDSTASTTFFRSTVGASSLTTTQLSSVYCYGLARNACRIAGRCYMHGATSLGGTKYVSYVDTASSSLVTLIQYTTIGGILISSDGYVWVGPANSTAERKTLVKYDQDGTLLLTVDVDNTEALTSGYSPFEDAAGNIWAIGIVSGSNRRAYQIHPTTGEVLAQSEDFIGLPLGWTEDNRAVIWDSSTGSYLLKEIEPLGRITNGTTALDDVVTDLCARVNLAAGDIDVTDLVDNVRGYSISTRSSVRSALEPLAIAYKFDAVESDNKVKFVARGAASVETISGDDLGAHIFGTDQPATIAHVRKLETELPREVAVRYEDADADYQVGTQYARRLTGQSDDVATIDIPLVLTAGEAAAISEFVLYERWASRTSQEIQVSRKYTVLEPTDVITVTDGSATHTLRIVSKAEVDGVYSLQTVSEDVSIYSPVSDGVSLVTPTTTVGTAGPTILRLLDIPLLRDADDGAGFYAAAAGYYAGWTGGELWRSSDGGTTYDRTTTAFLDPNVIGTALTALPNFTGGNVWDEQSTVQVQVFGGALSSSTHALVLAGANAAYLGGEIIQFRTATLVSTGKYTLTGLLRGRKGTEQYMSAHVIGDQFVLLNTSTTKRVDLPTADIGSPLIYKAPAFGDPVATAITVSLTPAGVGLKPLAPVLLGGGRTAAASYDIIINWTRRARLNAEWRDYVDVPVGETSEAYVVEIYTNSSYTTVKRTISGISTNTTTYTSAQQVTDFGSNQATIYVKVYQVSATVGNGYALTGTV